MFAAYKKEGVDLEPHADWLKDCAAILVQRVFRGARVRMAAVDKDEDPREKEKLAAELVNQQGGYTRNPLCQQLLC